MYWVYSEMSRECLLQEEMVAEEVSIDHRVHSRIIGGRGRGIRKIMDEFKVDVRFPRPNDPDPNLVQISGLEENVWDCKDHLLNLEEEFVSLFAL